MKKLFVLSLLMLGMMVNAQIATYKVVKTQVTLDKTWEDLEVKDATDQNILLVYNFADKKIHITNKDQSTFFLGSSENLEDYTDSDGDVLKSVHITAWDEEGLAVDLVIKWWEDEDVTFNDYVDALFLVYNADYWVKYYLKIEMYRE